MDSASALEGSRRYLSGLQPEDHHGDGVAQPPYPVANPRGQRYDREPRAGASELPSTDPQPRVRCGKAASCEGRLKGLSCMKGNFHVQFLGEGVAATSPPYPTLGWATTQVYPARNSLDTGIPSEPTVEILSQETGWNRLFSQFGDGFTDIVEPTTQLLRKTRSWCQRRGSQSSRESICGTPGNNSAGHWNSAPSKLRSSSSWFAKARNSHCPGQGFVAETLRDNVVNYVCRDRAEGLWQYVYEKQARVSPTPNGGARV